MERLRKASDSRAIASKIPLFLSVVVVVRNQERNVERDVRSLQEYLSRTLEDYEIIIVDNGSTDNTVSVLKHLCRFEGLPNIQVYCLINEVDDDVAFWVGIERSLGELTATLEDPTETSALEIMLLESQKCYDLVFAYNQTKGFIYRSFSSVFAILYRILNRVDVSTYSSNRLMSRKVVNFITQHKYPVIAYRYLPMNTKLRRRTLVYSGKGNRKKSLLCKLRKGMKYLIAGKTPLRAALLLSLLAASVNVLYTVYVLTVNLVLDKVVDGWTSMSLQISGMFFLMSLVMILIGEHILQSSQYSDKLLPYHIFDEFVSERVERSNKLNVDFSKTREVDHV